MKKIFAERLSTLRRAKNCEQSVLGKAVGVSDRAIRSYEKEEAWPRLDIAMRLADYFGVSLDWLCGRSDDPQRLP